MDESQDQISSGKRLSKRMMFKKVIAVGVVIFSFLTIIFSYKYVPSVKFRPVCNEELPLASKPMMPDHYMVGEITTEFSDALGKVLNNRSQLFIRTKRAIFITPMFFKSKGYGDSLKGARYEVLHLSEITNEAVKLILEKRQKEKNHQIPEHLNLRTYDSYWLSGIRKGDYTPNNFKTGPYPSHCAFLEQVIIKGGELTSEKPDEIDIERGTRKLLHNAGYVSSSAAEKAFTSNLGWKN